MRHGEVREKNKSVRYHKESKIMKVQKMIKKLGGGVVYLLSALEAAQ